MTVDTLGAAYEKVLACHCHLAGDKAERLWLLQFSCVTWASCLSTVDIGVRVTLRCVNTKTVLASEGTSNRWDQT